MTSVLSVHFKFEKRQTPSCCHHRPHSYCHVAILITV